MRLQTNSILKQTKIENLTFFGTHPTFTHVPPYRSCSNTHTLAPYSAARRAAALPPEPPPNTYLIVTSLPRILTLETQSKKLNDEIEIIVICCCHT